MIKASLSNLHGNYQNINQYSEQMEYPARAELWNITVNGNKVAKGVLSVPRGEYYR